MAREKKSPRKPAKKPGDKICFREETAKSLHDYVRITNAIHDSWDDDEDYSPDCWYRGVSNAEAHKLLPGFYRLSEELSYLEEDDYREEFRRRAPPLLDGRIPKTNWEWYFLMQHYGLPTRLLDWSEGALTGLFFAIEDFVSLKEPVADAAVWMLDPWYLNQWSIRSNEVLLYSEKRTSKYLCKEPFDEDEWPKKPVAILPTYNSRRLASQRGMFTIHGTDRRPLEEMLPAADDGVPGLAKITIPQKCIKEMREALRRTGVTDVVLFPELSSLALDMRRSWERP